jgi:copper(I)-binding protein
MKNSIAALLLLLGPVFGSEVPVWADVASSSSIQAQGAYVTAVPAMSENTAAYMVLKNPTDHAISLVGGSSLMAKAVEVHKHVMTNGKMKMVQIDSLEIPAHGEVKLAPKGLHLMLIGLKDSFRKASQVDLTLRFSDQSSLKLEAPIKSLE